MNLRFSIWVKLSKIDGLGAFAGEKIPSRKKVGELAGEIISVRKGRRLAATNKRIALVELDDQYALYAGDTPGVMRYINHSCRPNTYMRVYKYSVAFYALRDIKKGEELLCGYGETHHEGHLVCCCGAKGCKGFL